ncbi:ubiquinol-cytochrome c reductase iron-sulfur subunit [Ectobacillus ponti]|uniref:Rieske 2Fe-2S domain-containing protein n=1 Tax=Ectobacillus ponti TaxID=2961894 RepID=A0AA42BPG4_9BACI|nr:Rieske 2Fe-2S domain-containing protein [Ectobacillus ponti]MCP8967524.1 Rieske 2Fe-2S domain-containing protein [Ectobacillus ponti]
MSKRQKPETEHDMSNLIDNLKRVDDVKYNRRAFIKSMTGATVALGLATLPFQIAGAKKKADQEARVKIAELSSLPKGASTTFSYPTEGDTAILVHTVEGELVAYNNKCTHLQCPVFYEKERDILVCPCHRGFFDIKTGHPVEGPPQRELPLIELEVQDGKVYAVGRKYRHE